MRLPMKCPACEKKIIPKRDGFLLVCPKCGAAIRSIVTFTSDEKGKIVMERPK